MVVAEFEVAHSRRRNGSAPDARAVRRGIVAVELAGRRADSVGRVMVRRLAHVRVEGVSLPGYVPATVTTPRGTGGWPSSGGARRV